MVNERLNHAITKIDSALALIEKRLQSGEIAATSSKSDPLDTGIDDAELAELRRDHDAHIADRDRRIAKLRADIADIGRLKDEEIARLRGELSAIEDRDSAPLPANGGDPVLEAKYARLKATAEATIAGLDRVIAGAGQHRGGHG